jgi:hypothetical protein
MRSRAECAEFQRQEVRDMARSGRTKKITIGDNLGEIVLKAHGAMIEVHADGSADAYAGAVKAHPAANDRGKPVVRP